MVPTTICLCKQIHTAETPITVLESGSNRKFGKFLQIWKLSLSAMQGLITTWTASPQVGLRSIMGQLRSHFPNASRDLTVQQAVDVGAVGRACIPSQESLFSLLWLTEPFTGTLLNHRMVPLTPEQTQALKRRHGKADAPKACPPPLRHAGCSAPGLQNQGRAHC